MKVKTKIKQPLSIYTTLIISILLISCTNRKNTDIRLPSIENELPLIGERPLFKDFMGINGHFTFKPELYNQVGRLVRNYHDMDWDVEKPGDDYYPPFAVNGVNWKNDVYGRFKNEGYEIDMCIQLSSFSADNEDYKELWKDKEEWAYSYGKALASYFGPSGDEKL